MFKQQQKDELNIRHREKREDGAQGNRIAGFGIKVISNWIDDRRANNTSQSKKEHGKSPIIKNDLQTTQQPSKSSSNRGIKVISSRQSSNERPIATSRSNSKQKQSKQIKSQTNISEFDSAINSKEPSFEKQQTAKRQDYDLIIQAIEQRFKETILKQSAMYELQIDQLKQVMISNEQRIDNLINTLNVLVEGGGKKEKGLGRLQSRLASNQKYAQQCYEYTLARCSDSKIILRHLSESIHNNCAKNIEIQNKMEYIQRIMVDIFTVQRSLVYQQQANFHRQINRVEQTLINLEDKLRELEQLEIKHSLEHMRSINWKEHLMQLRRQLENYVGSATQNIDAKSISNYGWINRQELNVKMQGLQFKISQLEAAKASLEQQFKAKQENSQQAIWQLSALLNKHERQIEKIQKQNTSLINYNKEIEDKLIESRCRENSLELYMQNQLKMLQTSINDEQKLRISKENEVFRQKYEELFRHNQYLEDINCRNKLQLLNQAKIIEEFQAKQQEEMKSNQGISKILEQNLALSQEIQALKRKLSEATRKIEQKDSQIFEKSLQVQKVTVEIMTLRNQIIENTRKIQNLTKQIQSLSSEKESLASERQQLSNQFLIIQKELQEEELYSQHLQNENEKMENKLNEYTRNFEQQSLMFKTTIDRLKRERDELKPTEAKTDRPTLSRQNSSQSKVPSPSIAKAQQEKLLRLKKAIDAAGYKKPVPCEIDGTGYLKHLDQGTYIVDAQENLFDLTTEEKHLAIKTNLIQLFQ